MSPVTTFHRAASVLIVATSTLQAGGWATRSSWVVARGQGVCCATSALPRPQRAAGSTKQNPAAIAHLFL